MDSDNYAGKLKTNLTWWLSKKGFNINNEYKIDLLFIDRNNSSVKIKITNLKTGIAIESSTTTKSEVLNGQD